MKYANTLKLLTHNITTDIIGNDLNLSKAAAYNKSISYFPITKSYDYNTSEQHSQLEAMQDFVETISPCLSDQRLFLVTDIFCKAEKNCGDATQFLRGSSLAKVFFIKLIDRQRDINQPYFIALIKDHVLPMLEGNENFRQNKKGNLKVFISFNLLGVRGISERVSDDLIAKILNEQPIHKPENTLSDKAGKKLADILPTQSPAPQRTFSLLSLFNEILNDPPAQQNSGNISAPSNITINPLSTAEKAALTKEANQLKQKITALDERLTPLEFEVKVTHKNDTTVSQQYQGMLSERKILQKTLNAIQIKLGGESASTHHSIPSPRKK